MALGEVLLNVPQPTGAATQEKVLDALKEKALAGEGEKRERECSAWALAQLLRRHLPEEQAVAVLQEEVVPLLTSGQAAVKHGAVFTLAGACWCQKPQLEGPGGDLAAALKASALSALPALLGDKDPDVQAAAAILAAGAAKLHAAVGLPWAGMAELEDKLAALVAPSSSLPAATMLSAARHFGAAASAAGASSGARLAAAVAARGTDKSCATPEDAERALAAVLGSDGSGEAQVSAALQKLLGGADSKAKQVLQDYSKTRLGRIAQHNITGEHIEWDF